MRNPPAVTEPDIFAVLAVQAGTANSDQQRHAMRWIMNEACRVLGVADADCTDREAAVHEGRRTVGHLIARMGDPGLLKMVREAAKPKPAPKRGTPK